MADSKNKAGVARGKSTGTYSGGQVVNRAGSNQSLGPTARGGARQKNSKPKDVR